MATIITVWVSVCFCTEALRFGHRHGAGLASEYERIKKLGIGEISEIIFINIAAPYWCFWLTDPDGNCIEVTGAYTPERET